jgi:DNA topoisomerase-2
MEKTIAETYVKLSPIEHILKKPGMYIGDIDIRTEKQFIYTNNQIELKLIDWSPGLYKIIDELIVNAYDQSIRDSTLKSINVELDSDSFSIHNDGIGIDIVLHPTHKIYIPELIFANLLTSTNYNESEQRITGGTHGLGAKLSAIFSKEFIIEVWDKKTKLYYKQTISDNLDKINKPKISNQKNKVIGGVKITIKPDFKRFNLKNLSQDMQHLISKRVVDLYGLCTNNINITLNKNKIISTDFESYLNLYHSENEWLISHCVKNPLWSFAIRFNDSKTIDPGIHISFVNGIFFFINRSLIS